MDSDGFDQLGINGSQTFGYNESAVGGGRLFCYQMVFKMFKIFLRSPSLSFTNARRILPALIFYLPIAESLSYILSFEISKEKIHMK